MSASNNIYKFPRLNWKDFQWSRYRDIEKDCCTDGSEGGKHWYCLIYSHGCLGVETVWGGDSTFVITYKEATVCFFTKQKISIEILIWRNLAETFGGFYDNVYEKFLFLLSYKRWTNAAKNVKSNSSQCYLNSMPLGKTRQSSIYNSKNIQ